MKLRIGLYGAVINVLIVIGMLLFSALKRGSSGMGVYFSALPFLAVAAFVVYYFVVSAYVAKRPGLQKPMLFDSLAGMLAELIIITLGAVLYSVLISISHIQGRGLQAFASDLATGIVMNLLWVFALFMIHILIIGNIAGLVGWYILKKFDYQDPSRGR